jgi:hypothetical protein
MGAAWRVKGFYPAFDRDAMERIDTTAVGSVVDVGGASGSFVHALMMKNPLLRGVVFDLPFAVERAAERARELGIEARFATVPGDIFLDAVFVTGGVARLNVHRVRKEAVVKGDGIIFAICG